MIIFIGWNFVRHRFMSYTCLLMVLCECACANLISKANSILINRTDLFICLHIMFQISLQNSKRKKNVTSSFWVFGHNFCSVRGAIDKFAELLYY